MILKTDYFQLWFLYSRISTVRKHIGIIRIKHFYTLTNDNIVWIINQIQVSSVSVNRALQSPGHINLRLQSL